MLYLTIILLFINKIVLGKSIVFLELIQTVFITLNFVTTFHTLLRKRLLCKKTHQFLVFDRIRFGHFNDIKQGGGDYLFLFQIKNTQMI